MKNTVFAMALIMSFSATALAHDEGHGPKLSDAGKFGGLVSPVVKKSEAKLGPKAGLVHKAELARASDGTVRIYLYDVEMKPLNLEKFDKKTTATIGSRVKGNWKQVAFDLEQKNGAFVGKMPKPESKPYSIDVQVMEGGTELLSAFDNLD